MTFIGALHVGSLGAAWPSEWDTRRQVARSIGNNV
jgi:hypothetical protein